MAEKRILIVPVQLIRMIDENRDDMNRSEFIKFLIDSHLGQDSKEQHYVTRDELHEFQQGIKELLQNFLDFSVSYGLELGKPPVKETDIEGLDQKLGGLDGTFTIKKPEKSNKS
ncbi:hypothetical protein ACFLW2_03525 [Chloroflexota bacterium]